VAVLYEALLLLAFRVDGRGRLLGLLAAASGEEGAGESRAEGRDRELSWHLSACVHHQHLRQAASWRSLLPQSRQWRL
jgi:hypothetical protein